MKRMDWNKLITTERFKSESFNLKTDARTEFERDVDRIIFSTPFREYRYNRDSQRKHFLFIQ